jgi:hypothetical protein
MEPYVLAEQEVQCSTDSQCPATLEPQLHSIHVANQLPPTSQPQPVTHCALDAVAPRVVDHVWLGGDPDL